MTPARLLHFLAAFPTAGTSAKRRRERAAGSAASPSLKRAALAVLVAFLFTTVGAVSALAQSTTLVSNTAQTQSGTTNSFGAQSFATGSQGATVSEIQVQLLEAAADDASVSVKIRENNSDDEPGDLVATFTNPSTIVTGLNTFTAPANTTLAANTTYWVTIHEGISPRHTISRTSSDDQTGESGWTLGDGRLFRNSESHNWSTSSTTIRMAVVGTLSTSTGPSITIAAGTSPVTEGTAASFTLTADSAPSAALTVNLTVSESSNGDYVASGDEGSKTVTISSGSTTATYSVTTQDDTTDETNGSVTVTVGTGTGYTVGSTSSATVSVNDNDDPANNAPTVANAIPNQTATVGTAFSYAFPANTFNDADNDTLTYTATKSDDTTLPAWLTFTASTRTFSGTPTAAGTVSVKVKASDGTASVTDTFDIAVSAAKPAAPAAPTVGATSGSNTSLDVSWSAPANNGAAITDYDVRYKLSTASSWSTHAHTGTSTSATITGLTSGSTYNVQVRATNSAGTGDWSPSGNGTTSTPTNSPATGAPTISGFPQVGNTLTAATSGISDSDGLTSVSYSYQWIRVDGTTDTNISGATSSTYTLVAADSGKKVKVKVSFTDDASNAEELTSTATGTVAAAAAACTSGNAWCGTLTVGADPKTNGGAKGYCNSASNGDHGRCATTYGALSDTDFTLNGVTYDVESVRWGTKAGKNKLHLTLDKDLPSAHLSKLTLKVDTHSFTLNNATKAGNPNTTDHNYHWTGNATIRGYATGLKVRVEILDSNTAPTLDNAIPDQSATTGTAFSYAFPANTFSDGDSDTLTYTATKSDGTDLPSWLTFTAGTRTFSGTPAAGDVGTVSVKVTASDSIVSVTDTFNIVVSAAGTAPTVSTATLQGKSLKITFNKDLDTSKVPAGSAFAVKLGTAAQSLASMNPVAISGKVVTLTLGSAPGAGTVTVDYTKPGTGNKLTGTGGNEVASFSGQAVTRVAATFSSATTTASGTTVIITFNGDLMGPDPAAGSFTVTAGGTARTPTNALHQDATLTLNLPAGQPILAGQTVTVSYAKPATGNKLLDASGNEVASFSGKTVTNTVPLTVTGVEITSDPGADDTYSGGDLIEVTVTFSAPATVDTTGGTPTLSLRLNIAHTMASQLKSMSYNRGSGTTKLVFRYTVNALNDSEDPTDPGKGIGLPENGLALNGGTIKAGTVDATLTYSAVAHTTSHKVTPGTTDTTAPVLSSAAVNGATLTLTFDEALDTGASATPAASAFTVKVNGSAVNLAASTPVAISGSVVTLTLAAAVIDADTVTVSYAKPAANPLRNFSAGLEAADFTDQAATNSTTGVAPTVSGTPTVSGATLVITFDEALDTGSVPAASAFAVTVASNSRSVSNVAVSGSRVTLTLASAAVFGEAVTVQYTKPGTSPLRDKASPANDVANFGPLTVTNNDATAPTYSSSSVNGSTLTITFSENLDTGSVPAAGAFYVTVGTARRTVSNGGVAISGADVTLTLASAVRAADTVRVRYTKPSANPLRDGASNEVATFADQTVTNDTPLTVTGALAVSRSPSGEDTFSLGEPIEFRVTFSEPVTVTGAPRIAFTLGTATKNAAYRSGSGTATLTFRYTVAAADTDTDGIAVGADPLALNGGTIRAGSKDATLTLAALGTLSDRKVNGALIRSDPPAARAGADRTVNPGASVTLDGSGSSDPDGTIQSWAWSQVSGTTVTLSGADTARATFTAPTAAGVLVFRLTVIDDAGVSASDDVTVTVRDAPPRFAGGVAALRLQPEEAMAPVTLPAASGGNGGPYSYSLTSSPEGLAGLEFDEDTRVLSGTPPEEGRWSFTYRAHDGDANTENSDAATATFRVVVSKISPERRRVVKRSLAAVATRTVTSALDNIGARLGDGVPAATLTLAGEQMPLGASGAAADTPAGACAAGFGQAGVGRGFGDGVGDCAPAARSRGVEADALLTASAFSLALGAAGGDGAVDPKAPRWSVWGRGDFGSFAGRPEPGMRYEGELWTGWLGVDARAGSWVAGLAASHGRSKSEYSFDGGDDPDERGRLETGLNALYPYGRWTFADGLELRGMLGAGTGRLRHFPGGEDAPEEMSDLTMLMASLGLRRTLPPLAGIALAARGDASFARIETAGGLQEIDGLRADTWRGRVGVEASRRFEAAGGGSLTPFLDVAARRDGGDGLTGSGLEVAGGLRHGAPGIEAELRGRWLAAHTREDTRERGASLTVRMQPDASGRGLSVSLGPRWGAGTGGAEALWREEMPKAAPDADADARRETGAVDLRVGYGLPLFGGRVTGTPNVGFGLSEGGARDWRVGWRLTPAVRDGPGFEVNLDATRGEPADDNGPVEHGAMLRSTIRW